MAPDVTNAVETLLHAARVRWSWRPDGLAELGYELRLDARPYSANAVALINRDGEAYLPRIEGDDVWGLGIVIDAELPGTRSDLFPAAAEAAAQRLGRERETIRTVASTRYTWPVDDVLDLDIVHHNANGDVQITLVRPAYVPAAEERHQAVNPRDLARTGVQLLVDVADAGLTLADDPGAMQQLSDALNGETMWEPGQPVVDFDLGRPPFVARLWGPDVDDAGRPCYTELLLRPFWRTDLPEEDLTGYFNLVSSETYKIVGRPADDDLGSERIWHLNDRLALSITQSPDRVDTHLRQRNRLPAQGF